MKVEVSLLLRNFNILLVKNRCVDMYCRPPLELIKKLNVENYRRVEGTSLSFIIHIVNSIS